VCIHQLATLRLLCSAQLAAAEPEAEPEAAPAGKQDGDVGSDNGSGVGAVVFGPQLQLRTAGGSSQQQLLFAGLGTELVVLLLSQSQQADRGPAASDAPAAASDSEVQPQPLQPGVSDWRLQVLLRQAISDDDISSLSVNAQGTLLAAADDTGAGEASGRCPVWGVSMQDTCCHKRIIMHDACDDIALLPPCVQVTCACLTSASCRSSLRASSSKNSRSRSSRKGSS
jgi:hypothetical protein